MAKNEKKNGKNNETPAERRQREDYYRAYGCSWAI